MREAKISRQGAAGGLNRNSHPLIQPCQNVLHSECLEGRVYHVVKNGKRHMQLVQTMTSKKSLDLNKKRKTTTTNSSSHLVCDTRSREKTADSLATSLQWFILSPG